MAMKAQEMPFESALERLEAIVDRLEGGTVPLEEAVRLFEEGVGLRKRCLELLAHAEQRVKFLTQAGSGEATLTDPPADFQAAETESSLDP